MNIVSSLLNLREKLKPWHQQSDWIELSNVPVYEVVDETDTAYHIKTGYGKFYQNKRTHEIRHTMVELDETLLQKQHIDTIGQPLQLNVIGLKDSTAKIPSVEAVTEHYQVT